jgi:hypothetical protein
MSYYHYTKGYHLAKIVNDGLITTSKNYLDKKEKPVAWLTKSPIWEVTCNSGLVPNNQDLKVGQVYTSNKVKPVIASNDYMKKKIGMCRILVSDRIPVISWAKFKHVSGISSGFYYCLDKYSRSIGRPVDEWRCSFNAISRKYWEGIEMFVGDQWVRWDEKVPIQKFVEDCLSANNREFRMSFFSN